MQTNYFKIFNYILNNSPKFELCIKKTSFIMKTLNITVIFFLFLQISFAQDYVPFPMKDAVWNFTTFPYGIESKLSKYTNGDSIINNIIYTKIYQNSKICYPPTGNCESKYGEKFGYIREENKRIYLKLDGKSEFVIYDFNLKVGDTLPENIYNNKKYWIDKIDSIQITDGSYRKRYKISRMSNPFDLYIIEGIGATVYTHGFIPLDLLTDGEETLDCFSVGGKSLFPSQEKCEIITYNENVKSEFIELNSNLLLTFINLSWKSGTLKIKLFNTLGQQVFSDQSKISPYTLEKRSLSNGIYFLYCENEQKQSKVFKILVE